MITRFAKLKGFPNIIAGRDLANIFQDGHVYEVNNHFGEITIKDLGPHALMLNHLGHSFSTIMMDGTYLLTEVEAIRREELINKDNSI